MYAEMRVLVRPKDQPLLDAVMDELRSLQARIRTEAT
jgi:hypothetical protein